MAEDATTTLKKRNLEESSDGAAEEAADDGAKRSKTTEEPVAAENPDAAAAAAAADILAQRRAERYHTPATGAVDAPAAPERGRDPEQLTFRFMITNKDAGSVIGRGGSNVSGMCLLFFPSLPCNHGISCN
jgi:hypothetical protein